MLSLHKLHSFCTRIIHEEGGDKFAHMIVRLVKMQSDQTVDCLTCPIPI
jgi:hypothetical protein